MRVQISSRHTDVPDDVMDRAHNQLQRLTRYDPDLRAAEVIFDANKRTKSVEGVLHIDGREPKIATGEGDTFQGALDQKATTEQLEQVAGLIPEEWLAASATGSVEQCVDAINHQFDLGCDGVILHGASPTDLAPIVKGYNLQRDANRFAGLPANPALAKRYATPG